MMVNCPKCGFAQPEDRYCAKCGVDMVAYKPPTPPIYARILGNTFFQVMVLACLVICVFSFIRHRQTDELAARIAEIEMAPTQIVEKHAPVAEASLNNPQNNSQAAPPVSVADTKGARVAEDANHSSTSASTAPLSGMSQPVAALSETIGAAPGAPTELRVVFGEVSPATLSDAQSPSSYGPFYAGVISNVVNRLRHGKASGDWKEVDSSQAQALKAGQTALVFRGSRDEASGIPYGLTVKITPTSLDDSGTVVHVEISRVMNDTAADPQVEETTIPLPESFTIPKGSGAFVVGALPHRVLQTAEEKLYGNLPIFKVLKSETYRAGATDFAIFIEPK